MTSSSDLSNNSSCVFLSGMGIVTALGDSPETFTKALKEGRSGICRLRTGEYPLNEAALLTEFDFSKKLQNLSLPPEIITRALSAARRSPKHVQTAVYSALYAWQHAGIHRLSVDKEKHQRTGIIVAGQNLSSRFFYETVKRVGDDPEYISPSFGLHALDTDIVGTVSEILSIHGPGFTLGGASASGNVALIQASHLIKSGLVDRCLVIGATADLSPLELHALKNMGAAASVSLEEGGGCRPFDEGHCGFVYGQGSAAIMLENAQSIMQREGKSFAKMAGSALALDGNRSTDPSLDGETRVMTEAMRDASMTTADIRYINTHGTSSVLGDDTEIAAIRQVFSDVYPNIWLNSTKALTGHCLWSAGVVEAIATVAQISEGFVHPNINLQNPIDQQARWAGIAAETADIPNALSNSFGFGGINSAIVFSRTDDN